MYGPTDSHRTMAAPAAGAPGTLDEAVDAALATYPRAPLPTGFIARTMARAVQPAPAPLPARPQLGFLDLALPAFVTAVSVVIGVLLAGATVVDPLLAARLALWFDVTWGNLLPGVPAPGGLALATLAAGAGLAVLAITVVLDRTRRGYRTAAGA